ncbi:MAG: prolipoprotein diacylglyceryl transferase [Bacteroidia bacterium]|nr:prolipoprotein diacylglyceryl transferase [Bacteroidia bacterium]
MNFINWNVDPDIFTIGDRGIRWYGLLLAAGFYLAYLVLSKMLTKEGFSEKKINNFSLYMIIGTILGLRLGHCFFYEPEYYLSNPVKILKVWEGGLASHGGAAGIFIAIALFAWRNKLSYMGLCDRLAVVIALAGGFVRIGNLMNSEIIGRITSLPWGFKFLRLNEDFDSASTACALNLKQSICVNQGLPDTPLFKLANECNIDHGQLKYLVEQWPTRHPSQIYEALFCFILFVFMYLLYNKMKGSIKEGYLAGIFLIVLFTFRFFIEFVKDVQVKFEDSMAINMGQILSLPFIVIGILLVIYAIKKGRIIDFTLHSQLRAEKEKKKEI